MKAFGHNKLIELINSLVSQHKLIELNCLDGFNKVIKLTASGFNEVIIVGHNKLTELTSIVGNYGLVGRIRLFKLSELIVKYPIGLIVRINGLNRYTDPNSLIGLIGCCIIGLIDLLALSNHWFNGLVDFLGYILGLVGFIETSVLSASLGLSAT